MVHENTLPRDLGDMDAKISNARLGNGLTDFRPVIGVVADTAKPMSGQPSRK